MYRPTGRWRRRRIRRETRGRAVSPWHLTPGEFAADFSGLLVRWPHHNAFLDHFDYSRGRHGIEKRNVVGLAGREHFGSCLPHPGIVACVRAARYTE